MSASRRSSRHAKLDEARKQEKQLLKQLLNRTVTVNSTESSSDERFDNSEFKVVSSAKKPQKKYTKNSLRLISAPVGQQSIVGTDEPEGQLEESQAFSEYARTVGDVFTVPPSESSEYFTVNTEEVRSVSGENHEFYMFSVIEDGPKLHLMCKMCYDGKNYVTVCLRYENPTRKISFKPVYKLRGPLEAEIKNMLGDSVVNTEWVIENEEEVYRVELPMSYDMSNIPLTGVNYKKVLGYSRSITEHFLRDGITCPSWIHADCVQINTIYCSVPMYSVSKTIIPSDRESMPPFNVAIVSTVPMSENTDQIHLLSIRILSQWSLQTMHIDSSSTRGGLNSTAFVIETEAIKGKALGSAEVCTSQSELVMKVLTRLDKYDVDIITGFDIINKDLPLIIRSAMNDDSSSWHGIGRLRCSEPPSLATNATLGRMLCDFKTMTNDISLHSFFKTRLNVCIPHLTPVILEESEKSYNEFLALLSYSKRCTNLMHSYFEKLAVTTVCKVSGCTLEAALMMNMHEIADAYISKYVPNTHSELTRPPRFYTEQSGMRFGKFCILDIDNVFLSFMSEKRIPVPENEVVAKALDQRLTSGCFLSDISAIVRETLFNVQRVFSKCKVVSIHPSQIVIEFNTKEPVYELPQKGNIKNMKVTYCVCYHDNEILSPSYFINATSNAGFKIISKCFDQIGLSKSEKDAAKRLSVILDAVKSYPFEREDYMVTYSPESSQLIQEKHKELMSIQKQTSILAKFGKTLHFIVLFDGAVLPSCEDDRSQRPSIEYLMEASILYDVSKMFDVLPPRVFLELLSLNTLSEDILHPLTKYVNNFIKFECYKCKRTCVVDSLSSKIECIWCSEHMNWKLTLNEVIKVLRNERDTARVDGIMKSLSYSMNQKESEMKSFCVELKRVTDRMFSGQNK